MYDGTMHRWTDVRHIGPPMCRHVGDLGLILGAIVMPWSHVGGSWGAFGVKHEVLFNFGLSLGVLGVILGALGLIFWNLGVHLLESGANSLMFNETSCVLTLFYDFESPRGNFFGSEG